MGQYIGINQSSGHPACYDTRWIWYDTNSVKLCIKRKKFESQFVRIHAYVPTVLLSWPVIEWIGYSDSYTFELFWIIGVYVRQTRVGLNTISCKFDLHFGFGLKGAKLCNTVTCHRFWSNPKFHKMTTLNSRSCLHHACYYRFSSIAKIGCQFLLLE